MLLVTITVVTTVPVCAGGIAVTIATVPRARTATVVAAPALHVWVVQQPRRRSLHRPLQHTPSHPTILHAHAGIALLVTALVTPTPCKHGCGLGLGLVDGQIDTLRREADGDELRVLPLVFIGGVLVREIKHAQGKASVLNDVAVAAAVAADTEQGQYPPQDQLVS